MRMDDIYEMYETYNNGKIVVRNGKCANCGYEGENYLLKNGQLACCIHCTEKVMKNQKKIDLMEENKILKKAILQEIIYYDRLCNLGCDHGFDSDQFDLTKAELNMNEIKNVKEYVKRVYEIDI